MIMGVCSSTATPGRAAGSRAAFINTSNLLARVWRRFLYTAIGGAEEIPGRNFEKLFYAARHPRDCERRAAQMTCSRTLARDTPKLKFSCSETEDKWRKYLHSWTTYSFRRR